MKQIRPLGLVLEPVKCVFTLKSSQQTYKSTHPALGYNDKLKLGILQVGYFDVSASIHSTVLFKNKALVFLNITEVSRRS